MARVFPASGVSRYAPVFMRRARSNRRPTSSRLRSVTARKSRLAMGCPFYLEDIAAQVFVIDDAGEPVAHPLAVEHDVLLGEVGQVEQHFFEQRGHDGVEPARADVLH